jgi:beta-glucosidase
MSDAGGTDRLCTSFKTCRADPIDKESVTLQALPAGNDVEMGGGSLYVYPRHVLKELQNLILTPFSLSSNFASISDLVDAGTLDIKVVDTAVSRLLRAKFEMGLFEHPYRGAPADEQQSIIHTEEAVELARELDKESIVLLENHNATLPLKKSGSIAVIGPMAHGFMNVSKILFFPIEAWRCFDVLTL